MAENGGGPGLGPGRGPGGGPGGLEPDAFRCWICGDLLREPASVPCGHSFCLGCISAHWEDAHPSCSCPQCGHSFSQRPVLAKNTILDVLMEQLQKKRAAPADPCYADLGDAPCELCPGPEKRRAVRACAQCRVSYCGEHLRPHREVDSFKRHKLVQPPGTERSSVCARHGAPLQLFCRSEQLCVCFRCAAEEHQGHSTVSMETERRERQERRERSRRTLLRRLTERERDVGKLQQELEGVRRSADSAVDLCDKSLAELTRLLELRLEKVKQELRELQEEEERPLRDLKHKLEEDLSKLTVNKAQLEALEETADPIQFFPKFKPLLEYVNGLDYDVFREDILDEDALPLLSVARSTVRELHVSLQSAEKQEITGSYAPERLKAYVEDGEEDYAGEEYHGVLALAGRTKSKLWDKRRISTDNKNGVTHLHSQSPLRTRREEFLPYAQDIVFDLDTAHPHIVLASENRVAKSVAKRQSYRKNPQRFNRFYQVLSKEPLTGRCYFEVKLNFEQMVVLALAYKDMERKGHFQDACFQSNPNSWSLCLYSSEVIHFRHNNQSVEIWWSGCLVDTLGVFLDHDMGILAFYSVKKERPSYLIHEIHTTFTRPLHFGVGFKEIPCTAEVLKLT